MKVRMLYFCMRFFIMSLRHRVNDIHKISRMSMALLAVSRTPWIVQWNMKQCSLFLQIQWVRGGECTCVNRV